MQQINLKIFTKLVKVLNNLVYLCNVKNKKQEYLESDFQKVQDVLLVKGYNEALKYFKTVIPNEPSKWYWELLTNMQNTYHI